MDRSRKLGKLARGVSIIGVGMTAHSGESLDCPVTHSLVTHDP
jgi:hypothetical protein